MMKSHLKTYSIEDPAHPAVETIARRQELKELTGCSHIYVIEGHCSEPGCFNSMSTLGLDNGDRLAKAMAEGADPFSDELPKPIINTKPRRWCVL